MEVRVDGSLDGSTPMMMVGTPQGTALVLAPGVMSSTHVAMLGVMLEGCECAQSLQDGQRLVLAG